MGRNPCHPFAQQPKKTNSTLICSLFFCVLLRSVAFALFGCWLLGGFVRRPFAFCPAFSVSSSADPSAVLRLACSFFEACLSFFCPSLPSLLLAVVVLKKTENHPKWAVHCVSEKSFEWRNFYICKLWRLN